MADLKGKFAVVTGGGKGIGAAIAKRFIQEQAAGVAIWDYDGELAVQTAAALGSRAVAVRCDVSSAAQAAEATAATLAAFGRIDILVNNAGITRDAQFCSMTEDQWDSVLHINLDGPFYCCKQIVPLMREQGYGKIVNISSSSANGNFGQANYAASKAGLLGLTKTLAKELAAQGITVNAITPAMIDTDMMRGVPPEILEKYIKGIPARRLGTVDELAAAAYFLASDDSSFITGATLPVNGGTFIF